MIEKLRFRCPCCGMVADVDRLDQNYRIKVFLQRMGGKIAGDRKGRGKAEGFMEYEDVTKSHSEIVEEIRDRIRTIAK